MDPIAVLIHVIIVIVILGLVWFLIDRFLPVDRQFKVIIQVILVVIAILYLLRALRVW